jgi:hypothetical protein
MRLKNYLPQMWIVQFRKYRENNDMNESISISRTSLDRTTGILLIFAFCTSMVAAALSFQVGDYNIVSSEIGTLLGQIAEKSTIHIAEIGVDLFSYMLTIGLGAALYVLLSPYHRLFALLGTFGFTSGAIILAAHDIPHFVLTTIAKEFVAATGSQAEILMSIGFITLQTAMWGLSIGIAFLGLGGLFYGLALIKSEVVHKAIGWLGVTSGLLIAAGVWMPRFDQALFTLFTSLAAPFGIWQLALGLWLLIKGSKE